MEVFIEIRLLLRVTHRSSVSVQVTVSPGGTGPLTVVTGGNPSTVSGIPRRFTPVSILESLHGDTVFSVHDERIEKFEVVDPTEGTTDIAATDGSFDVAVGRPVDHDPVGPTRGRDSRGRGRRVLPEPGSGHHSVPQPLTRLSRDGYGATAVVDDVGAVVGAVVDDGSVDVVEVVVVVVVVVVALGLA